jgi:hypothetical protein
MAPIAILDPANSGWKLVRLNFNECRNDEVKSYTYTADIHHSSAASLLDATDL